MLKIKCQNCKEYFKYPSDALTRAEIENKVGRYFRYQCPHCLSNKEYHVNDIRAHDNQKLLLLYFLFALFANIGTLIYFWSIGLIPNIGFLFMTTIGVRILIVSIVPFVVFLLLKKQMEKKNAFFNKHRVSKTR